MLKKILLSISLIFQTSCLTEISNNNLENVCDETLLVSINNEESLKFIDYKKHDFYSKYIVEIEDLTSSYKKIIDNESYNKKESFHRIYKIKIDKNKVSVNRMKKILEHIDFIEDVSFDAEISISTTTTNDPYASSQWAIDKIQLDDAWDLEKGDESVKIGIIDSGIDNTHLDLIGRVDESLSESFVASSHGTALQDNCGHGTHVAGIIGGCPNDYGYIAGVCWDVTLVSLKVIKSDGKRNNSDIASAINYANANEIDLLNISINSSSNSLAVKNAMNNFPGLIVCSAGNDGIDSDVTKVYYNEYTFENIICVGNSNINDIKSSSSNYGKETVDLFAPGDSILSNYPTNLDPSGLRILSGTSMAAPYVTGVAALLKAQNTSLTWEQIKIRILDNVDYISSLGNLCVSGGRLNAYKALTNSQHIHSNSIQRYNLEYHLVTCSPCGNVVYQLHNWVEQSGLMTINDVGTNALLKKYVCSICSEVNMF